MSNPKCVADFVFEPAPGAERRRRIVATTVDRFRQESPSFAMLTYAGSSAPTSGDDRRAAARGAHDGKPSSSGPESRCRARTPTSTGIESTQGLTVLRWPELETRGTAGTGAQPAVRHVPRALREHVEDAGDFGSTTSTAGRSHPTSAWPRSTDGGEVVGYVLGSTYTAGAAGADERSAHTDYIGVRAINVSGESPNSYSEDLAGRPAARVDVASLGTDIENRSNAHLLYARLGYVAVEQSVRVPIDARGIETTATAPISARRRRSRETCIRCFAPIFARSPRAAWNVRGARGFPHEQVVG